MDFIPISNQLSDFQRAFLLRFYRSQFWRLQKLLVLYPKLTCGFIGHNFGDYKNQQVSLIIELNVLSVTILETTKTVTVAPMIIVGFYRSQFWRLQKPPLKSANTLESFIGHNFGDYKNLYYVPCKSCEVLSVTILETTKTSLFFYAWTF